MALRQRGAQLLWRCYAQSPIKRFLFSKKLCQTARRQFHATPLGNCPPETPLHFYKAESGAINSINHRMFYINWLCMLFAWDTATALVDF